MAGADILSFAVFSLCDPSSQEDGFYQHRSFSSTDRSLAVPLTPLHCMERFGFDPFGSADLSASFAPSVLSLLSPPLTSSRLSRSCLGDLKYPWLGWPTSRLAGWLSWRLEVAPCQVAGVDLYMWAMWAGGSPRAPDSISYSAKLARC